MALAGLLQQSAIIPAMKANSKKQLLQELAAKAAKITGLPEREIFDVIAFPGVRRPMAYGIVGSELSEAVWIDSARAAQGGSPS